MVPPVRSGREVLHMTTHDHDHVAVERERVYERPTHRDTVVVDRGPTRAIVGAS
jgi:hypothetical protein